MITDVIRKATSHIRRFQKRFIVTGFMLPPITYNNLLDIMTIMVSFYKYRDYKSIIFCDIR